MNPLNQQDSIDQIVLNDRRGSAALESGDFAECQRYFETNLRLCRASLERRAHDPQQFVNLAVALERMAKLDEARQDLSSAAFHAHESVGIRRRLLADDPKNA